MSVCEKESKIPVLHNFCGPVTALTVLSFDETETETTTTKTKSSSSRNVVVVGCGNEVSVFCLKSYHLETRIQVLHGACIHGFSKGSFDESRGGHNVCVYGAKQARVVSLTINQEGNAVLTLASQIRYLPDWIWEAKWLDLDSRSESIAFALAHNIVIEWKWELNEIVNRRDCVETCILYCAHLIGSIWDDLILAAGTVFNQVVLWKMAHDSSSSQDSTNEFAPVMHTFGGHKGVIFSIRYHAEHQRLCSVSDDRSIRMWQIDFSDGNSASDWKNMKSTLLLSVFGHSARVFGLVLMKDCFASIGEDATCCIWNYSGDVVSKFKGHKGKSIWSIANTQDEKHLLTGGGDGSIRMWRINVGEDSMTTQRNLDVSTMLPLSDGDFPRTVTLLDHNRLLIMINSGSLYLYWVAEKRIECLFQDSRFMSYSIVSACANKTQVAVGSIGGVIKILHLTSGTVGSKVSTEKSLFDSKVLGLVWITPNCLVATGPGGIAYILHLTQDEGNSSHGSSLQIFVESKMFLPVSKHRWISAACFVETSLDSSKNKCLACGDKSGTIYSYALPLKDEPSQDLIQPSQVFPKIHGKNGVTSMCFKDDVLYSLGRDGCCRHWVIKDGALVLLHGSKVTKGFEWIDHLEFCKGDMFFYGFFSSQFVVWSQLYNQKVFSVECGGGHRSWGCSFDNQTFRFAYLKGGQVHIVDSSQCSKHEILKPALHGRELNDLKILGMSTKQDLQSNFLTFTGSEDTMINIGLYHHEQGFTCWKPLAELKGHLSSIRALALSCDHSFDSSQTTSPSTLYGNEKGGLSNAKNFILFSGGGRAEIRIWKVSFTFDASSTSNMPIKQFKNVVETNNSETCETTSTVSCTHCEWSTHYLGESRHKRPFSKWKARKLQLDPETRVMSLDSTSVAKLDIGSLQDEISKHLYIISVAGSDGLFRVFCYNDQTRKLRTLAQSRFHNGCVLKVIHFNFKSNSNNLMFLAFSTSTNGKIAVWSMASLVTTAIDLEQKNTANQHSHDAEAYESTNSNLDHRDIVEGACGSLDATFPDENDPSCDLHQDKIDTNDNGNPSKPFDKGVGCGGEEESFQPMCSLPAHQSGINSIDVWQADDKTILLASGGDDNALTVQLLDVVGKDHIQVRCSVTNANAHSAQITGLNFVSSDLVVSASIDQRICVWQLYTHCQQVKMELVSCCYIYLADVSCMDAYVQGDTVYLNTGGEGMCLYSWNKKS